MNFKLILSISKTHLTSKLKQSSIAALGVTFGIGAYIILMSFMTGLNGLLDGLILNRTPHIQLYNEIATSEKQPLDLQSEFENSMRVVNSVKPKQTPLQIHNSLQIIHYLEKHPDVLGVNPQVSAPAFYNAGTIQLNGIIAGIDVVKEVNLYNFNQYIVEGKSEDLILTENGVILGVGAATKLAKKIGDVVQVSNNKGTIFPLKIVALYQSGLAELDDKQAFTTLKTAQIINEKTDQYITGINIKLKDMSKAVALSKEFATSFNISAIDIQTANAQFETGSSIRNMISYAVSITLLIVAGFGIYNILNMMIFEKMNDIAILKAVGFSGSDVKWVFISQAMIIGFLGGLLGLIIGFGVSVLIDNTPFETKALPTIKTFPINYNPMFYTLGIVFALVATFFAGYLPAKKAEKIDPVDIIRGQ